MERDALKLDLPKTPKKKQLPVLDTPVVGRVCLFCAHLYLSLGQPGYSELTPPSPAYVACLKDRWSLGEADGRKEFRIAMLTAERCPDFIEDRKP